MTQTLREFIEKNAIKIDRDIFTQLWNIIEGGDWVYLSRKIVKDYLVTSTGDDAVTNFYRRHLIPFFQVDVDYKQTEAPSGIQSVTNTKHFSVTKKTLIALLCKSKNVVSFRFLEYFYELQNLVVQFYKSQYIDHKESVAELMQTQVIIDHSNDQNAKYEELESKQKDGYVYFIHEVGDLTCFKIGYAQNINTRISTLQTGNKRKLACFVSIESNNMSEDEAYLHEYFSDSAVHGEWFAITTDDIYDVVEHMADRKKDTKVIQITEQIASLQLT